MRNLTPHPLTMPQMFIVNRDQTCTKYILVIIVGETIDIVGDVLSVVKEFLSVVGRSEERGGYWGYYVTVLVEELGED